MLCSYFLVSQAGSLGCPHKVESARQVCHPRSEKQNLDSQEIVGCKRNQNGTKQSINIHFKLNLSEFLLKSVRGSVIIFHFCPHLILTFTGLNEVGPPQSFSSVIQYSQLDASFCCLFIYAQTCLSHYPLNLENPAQIN